MKTYATTQEAQDTIMEEVNPGMETEEDEEDEEEETEFCEFKANYISLAHYSRLSELTNHVQGDLEEARVTPICRLRVTHTKLEGAPVELGCSSTAFNFKNNCSLVFH